jgi:acyl carrier protein
MKNMKNRNNLILTTIKCYFNSDSISLESDLIEDGFVDSLSFMDLVVYISEQHDLKFSFENLNSSNPSRVISIIESFS